MRLFYLAVPAMLSVLSACAEKAQEIAPTYVSPVAYQSFSCRQIAEEATRVSGRVAQLSGVQDKQAADDAVATGVALVLFWPAAFLVKGDEQNAAELARMKGEFEALEQSSIQKNCGLVFKKPAVAEEAAE